MNILHIIVDLDVGGAETMLKRLLEADPSGISSNVVVSLTSVGQNGQYLRSRGVRIHDLRMRSAFDLPVALWHLVRLIQHYRPQIIQTWMYHADLLGGLAAHFAGNKNVVWGVRRSDVSLKSLGWTVLVMKACALLSRWIPKKIICVANAARNTHIAAGYDPSRMVVIPNGFDFKVLTATTEERTATRAACGFAETDTVLGCIGRFHPSKGHDNFVKAARILVCRHSNLKFLLIGRGCDSHNAKLSAWLRDAGLQDHFVMLGERSDVRLYLAAMDLFCMPSRTEGFPNSLGEAMAMGLPCVATLVGDTNLLAGNTVVMVPPQDERALADGLLTVLNLTCLQRKKMGQVAKARVMRKFSIEKVTSKFSAVYKGMVLGTEVQRDHD